LDVVGSSSETSSIAEPQFLGLIGKFLHCLFSYCPLPLPVLNQFLLVEQFPSLNQKAGALVVERNFSFFQQIQEAAVRNVENFRGLAGGWFFFFHHQEAEIRFRMKQCYRRLRSQFDPEGIGPLVKTPVFPFPNRKWLPAGRPFARRMLLETCRVDLEASEFDPASTRLGSLPEVLLRAGAPALLEVRRERSGPRPHPANGRCVHWGVIWKF
jgi:hypothetical protein